MKTRVFVLVLLVFTALLIALIVKRHPVPEKVSRQPQTVIRHPSASPAAEPVVEKVQTSLEPPKPKISHAARNRIDPTPPAPVQVAKQTNTPPATAQVPPANRPQRKLQDPLARVALYFVGEDPDADAYWMDAIFDTRLPDAERDDLMEDLNEAGFADPQSPGPEDLPLILNRLGLIEELAPHADDFMARHLGEAWKDLNNMGNQVLSEQ